MKRLMMESRMCGTCDDEHDISIYLYNTVTAPVSATRNALAFKDYDGAMLSAAINGHLEIVKLCKEWGATDYDGAMWSAAINGHLEIVKLCKEWGATDYDGAMLWAALNGHLEIVKLCKEWGATDYDGAMLSVAMQRSS